MNAAIHIPFLDLKAGYEELKPKLDEAYQRFMSSGWYVLGQEANLFEEEYAAYCGSKHCIGVSNGLVALEMVLSAWGIGPGDEVIVPANTYIATWLAVSSQGATPVPVEPDETTRNLDPSRLEDVISPRTKGIVPVHLYGIPADMDPIMAVAERHGLFVLEDNAQAQGARYNGRRTGSLGHAAAHSFYPGKNLGAFGEAGAITTDDDSLAEQLRVARNYGSRVKYHNEVKGINARIDGLQCAFLRVKLAHLDDWNARRQRLARLYLDRLGTVEGLQLPQVPDWADPVWHLFVIRHPHRDRLQQALAEHGIGTLIHYPIPPHRSEAYRHDRDWGALPITEAIARECLSLPIGPQMAIGSLYEVADTLDKSLPSNGI